MSNLASVLLRLHRAKVHMDRAGVEISGAESILHDLGLEDLEMFLAERNNTSDSIDLLNECISEVKEIYRP